MKKRLFSIALFAIVLLIFVMTTMVVVKGENHDSIDFEEWNETNSLPTTTGSYVLNNDITLPSSNTFPCSSCVHLFLISLNVLVVPIGVNPVSFSSIS